MRLIFGLAAALLGAAARADEPAILEEPITAADRDHWSFRPVAPQIPPAVADAAWVRNPIDRFILAKLEGAGLRPLGEASKTTLIRRVTFDLTGLPPAPRDIEQFLQDTSPDAYDRLVDRLLASPAYGERWAQHWLDLVRFAETDGYEFDHVRPEAWRYRDWVIRALNRDLPYDEFVRLQLAGDELGPGDPEARDAARFLLCGPDMPDINLQEERRHSFLNDLTGTVGSVFLGLQIGCAQCHDHKYEPLSQADFYRLRAFFDPSLQFEARKAARLREKADAAPSHFMVRGDFRRKGPQLERAFPRVVNPDGAAPAQVASSGVRAPLAEWLTRPDHPLTTRVVVNRLWQHHFGRALARTPNDLGLMGQWPAHAELLDWLAAELPRRGWSLKSMHRLMVGSAAYRQASRTSEPHWSADQRRRAQDAWSRGKEADGDNELFWRMNRRRLEGEAVRDAMLAVSQSLSQRRGGPGVRPPLPPELSATLLKGQWPVAEDEEDHRRRSVYLFVRRNLQYPFFDAFDRPSPNESCPERNRSTTAPQALMLLNSEQSLAAARRLSGLLLASGADPRRQIDDCFQRTLGRPPSEAEAALALDYLAAETARLKQENRQPAALALPVPLPPQADPHHAAALASFCLSVFNLNEFVYVD